MKYCQLYQLTDGVVFIGTTADGPTQMVNNPDGSVSFQNSHGVFCGVNPTNGTREDGGNQQYQRATLTGNVVTFYPLAGYPMYSYGLALGQVYPA